MEIEKLQPVVNKDLLEPLEKKLFKLEEAFMENRPLTRQEVSLDKAIKDKDKIALEMYFERGSIGDVRKSLRDKASNALLDLTGINRSLAPPGIEFNKGFYDSLVKETNKNTYNAEKMLADISKYESNTEIGRVARMLLNSSVIPKYELQNIHVTRGKQGGSYYANFFENGKRRSFISMGREHVAHPETGLHEIVHGLAVSQVTRVQNPRYISTGAEWETAADNLINLYKFVRQYRVELGGNFYGLKDELEFVSEAMVNKEFQDYLKTLNGLKESIQAETLFPPRPRKNSTCTYCDINKICVKSEMSHE
jgi:hypothetical protein